MFNTVNKDLMLIKLCQKVTRLLKLSLKAKILPKQQHLYTTIYHGLTSSQNISTHAQTRERFVCLFYGKWNFMDCIEQEVTAVLWFQHEVKN